jgi:hypothetical protein
VVSYGYGRRISSRWAVAAGNTLTYHEVVLIEMDYLSVKNMQNLVRRRKYQVWQTFLPKWTRIYHCIYYAKAVLEDFAVRKIQKTILCARTKFEDDGMGRKVEPRDQPQRGES